MTTRKLTPALALLAVIAGFMAAPAGANETLVNQNFDSFDLNALPPLYSHFKPEELAIVEEAGRGKVLRIKHGGGDYPSLNIYLDAGKTKGQTIRVTCNAKITAKFNPVPNAQFAEPKIQIYYRTVTGEERRSHKTPEIGSWSALSLDMAVPADVETVSVNMRIDLVAAECFFDDVKVELIGAAAPAVANPANPAVPPNPNPAANPGPAAVAAPTTPAQPNLPAANIGIKKTIEKEYMDFNSEIVDKVLKTVRGNLAVKNTVLFAGPGLPIKEPSPDSKLPDKWQTVPASAALVGAAATPYGLLAALPEFLHDKKPEVVFLVAEQSVTRKLSHKEAMEWEDVSRLCMRMGAIPILCVPPLANIGAQNEANSTLRKEMLDASVVATVPALDIRTAKQLASGVGEMLKHVDQYVFRRKVYVQADPNAKNPNKTVDE